MCYYIWLLLHIIFIFLKFNIFLLLILYVLSFCLNTSFLEFILLLELFGFIVIYK